MDRTNDVAFALNASLGNHMHANGISLELYAKGYHLAPDAGIGWSLYSGDDYKEYYSQFPAHNTVMVNSRSTYQVMKSYHPFTLEAHGENWATVRFREPCTGADQQRGLDEVATWYFEVWNEPNLYNGFFHGTRSDYFELYRVSANAVKRVSPRLKVGGPATSNFIPDARHDGEI